MIQITWLGTASIRIEAAGERILFDPFVQLKGGENPNCFADFEEDELVFITHGHLDHLMDVPEFLNSETAEATVYCGSVAGATLSGLVENTGNVVEIKPGDEIRIGGVTVRVWEGKHAVPGPKMTMAALVSGKRGLSHGGGSFDSPVPGMPESGGRGVEGYRAAAACPGNAGSF